MLRIIFGTIYPKIFANFIQIHSIYLARKGEIIPVKPTDNETIIAQFHENTRYRTRNPIEMIKIVEFVFSFFIILSFKLKQCVYKWSNRTCATKHYQNTQY